MLIHAHKLFQWTTLILPIMFCNIRHWNYLTHFIQNPILKLGGNLWIIKYFSKPSIPSLFVLYPFKLKIYVVPSMQIAWETDFLSTSAFISSLCVSSFRGPNSKFLYYCNPTHWIPFLEGSRLVFKSVLVKKAISLHTNRRMRVTEICLHSVNLPLKSGPIITA